MNKPFLKFSAFFFASALLVACGSDDDAKSTEETGAEFPTEYSDLTIEENKGKLQDNGIEFVNSVEALKNASGIETTIAFSNFVDASELPNSLEVGGRRSSLPIFNLVNNLKAFATKGQPVDRTLEGMRKAGEVESIQTEFNQAAGIYTYNREEQTFDFSEGSSDKIVFKFPSKDEGTTNNAEYTIYNYKGVKVTNSAVEEDYTGEYPTSLNIDLKIDGQKKLGYALTAAYNSKGEPTAFSLAVTVDAYVLAYEVSNDGSKASVRYSLKQNDKNLYVLGADAEGNFNTGDIEDSNGGDDVVNKGTIYFQMLNIKFSGEIDVTALMAAIKAIPNQEDEAEEKAEAAAWNANTQMIVFYADSKKKIAEGEVVTISKTREYYDCVLDENENWDCGWKNEEYISKDVQLVFADDTRMSLETFGETGFDNLSEKIKDLVGE